MQTYGELLSLCIRIAQYMKANGLKPGDVVCFCSLNRTDCNAAVFATYLAGGIFSALDPIFCVGKYYNLKFNLLTCTDT